MSTTVRPWAEFSKEELLELSKELVLDVDSHFTSYELAHEIDSDLQVNGVPPEEECSELLDTFLFTYGYITEDGAVVDEWPELTVFDKPKEPADEEESAYIIKNDVIVIGEETFPKYGCFSMAEQRDPACRKCKIQEVCMAERIRVRPPCFGDYLATNEECKVCIEALPCSQLQGEHDG